MSTKTATRTHDSELTAALRARGQRVTSQRLILHRTLRDLGRHTTAEELLREAGDRLPGVSLPTVYATLELFEELGVARRVEVGGGPVLWDPRAEDHQHFACRRCGRVVDLDATVRADGALRAARAAGHSPDTAQVVVVGLCDRCAAAAG
ncbi:MAG: Fur family transcriptional regulator, stress-responsive regulator [Solirubrobacteraceae bacterium]|jgi:Fe2+ or Zn2+ uptake regulation protein|nr:Fur family transcriptional regulator, stress-responsive regulator [Solirubrobacteraceae bacterium]MEA2399219.1 Fur family transcriptional regulator, stress-responsive regulator [Thermoleophilaceae bacterium]